MCLGVEEVYAKCFYGNPTHVYSEVFPGDGFESYRIHVATVRIRGKAIHGKKQGLHWEESCDTAEELLDVNPTSSFREWEQFY